jgi:hypothetical protein
MRIALRRVSEHALQFLDQIDVADTRPELLSKVEDTDAVRASRNTIRRVD